MAQGANRATTCHTELCDANASDCLTALQQQAIAVKAAFAEWLPWNYRDAPIIYALSVMKLCVA
jgi:hypothetical protein